MLGTLLRNALFGWGKNLILGATNLALVPILINAIGKEAYGVFALLTSFILLLMFVDSGVSLALDRVLSEYNARKQTHLINKSLSTVFFIDWIIIALVSSVLYLLSGNLVYWFNISSPFEKESIWLITYFAPFIFGYSILSPIFISYLRSKNRFDIENTLISLSTIIKFIILIVLNYFDRLTISTFAYTEAGTKIILLIALWGKCQRLDEKLSINPRLIHLESIIPIYSLGIKFVFLKLIGLFRSQSDPFILTHFLGPVSVAVYKPAFSLVTSLRPFASILSEQLVPMLTQLHVRKDNEKEKLLLIRGTKYTMLMGLPALVVIFVLKRDIFTLWLGDSLGSDFENALATLTLWCWIEFVSYLGGTQYPFLVAKNRLKVLIWYVEGPVAVINFILSVYLVGFAGWGVKGVVVGTLIAGIVANPIMTLYCLKISGIPIFLFLKEAYQTPIITSVCIYVTMKAFLTFGGQEISPSGIKIILTVVVGFLTWLFATFTLMDNLEKKLFKKKWGQLNEKSRQ